MRRSSPCTIVPVYIRDKMASYGLYISTADPNTSLTAFVDLASGGVLLRATGGPDGPPTSELQLDPVRLAEVAALAEAAWAEAPPRWGHPHTVVGSEELAIVDGPDGCYEEANSGWFTDGAGKDLVQWAIRMSRDPR